MSLQIETTFKGLNIPAAYSKITTVIITEETNNSEIKTYKTDITVNTYTDNTKEFDIEQRTYSFEWITEEQFTLPASYEALKTLPDFEWAIDV